jgi:uncharacterized membrane protein (UPF0127 family)
MNNRRSPTAILSAIVTASLLAFCIGSFAPAAFADGGADAKQLDRVFQRDTLKVATPDARLHTFKAWVADDDQRRERGLMFVKQMDADAAMFIVYDTPQPVGIWMKNCFIALDILFVDASGRVVKIHENAQPGSEKTMSSPGDVLAVVELLGGTAKQLHIAVGAQVMHPVFERAVQNASAH